MIDEIKNNKSTNWTENQIKYLENNYKSGFTFCATYLNKKPHQVHRKAKKLGLKLTKDDIHLINVRRRIWNPEDYKVNPEQFINVQTPEAAYILGLLWADGTIKTKCYITRIGLVKEDFDLISHIFDKTGQWASTLSNFHNRRPAIVKYTCNKILWTYLYNNDYYIKSGASADKILSRIPDGLKHYWWRGYSDGDGCFMKNAAVSGFQITSVIDQDWSFVEKIFNQLNINSYKIYKTEQKNGYRSSDIKINNAFDIEKFGSYLYSTYAKDGIGLSRKYNKFLLIKDIAAKLRIHNNIGELPYKIDKDLLELDRSNIKVKKNGYKEKVIYDVIKFNTHISKESLPGLTGFTKDEISYCISNLKSKGKIISNSTGKTQYYAINSLLNI